MKLSITRKETLEQPIATTRHTAINSNTSVWITVQYWYSMHKSRTPHGGIMITTMRQYAQIVITLVMIISYEYQ